MAFNFEFLNFKKEKGLQGGGSAGLLREKKQSQPAEGMGLRLMIEITE